ncbi:uncharacterized protein LOC123527529 [Mercenaria mercenaria]|uniref:uncharacterized protein LOC123527529 n=1 Tax=Mercenaria mercenaria TaxID=6596 RepID=UPI00234E6174|nr:uncharacterized protein LOC123527529 [Mercenaria mercenaria]
MATGECELTSDEMFVFECTLCVKRKKNGDAVKYCAECQGYCCRSCVEMHKDIHALINHNMLKKSSLKSTVLRTELSTVLRKRCSVHETEVLEMYCQNHDEFGCSTCMALNHKKCEELKSVSNIVDAIYKKSPIKETLLTLENKKTWMNTVKKNKENLLQKLKKSKEEAIDTIKKIRQEVECLPNEMEKESIKDVEMELSKIKSYLQHDIHMAEKEVSALQSAKDGLQRATGNEAEERFWMRIAQMQLNITESVIQSLHTQTDMKMLFSPDQEIINFLQQMIESFGIVQCYSLGTSNSRKTLYAVKATREVNIRTQNDTNTCCVLGSCFTQDGMLLLADYNNKTLKLVDLVQMVVVDRCNLGSKPCDVCCVTKREAVVGLTNNTVQFVSLGNQMELSRLIKVDHICYGIAYHDDRLYITDGGKSLYIHDMTGNVLQTVTKDNSGNDLFKWSTHVAFSDTGDKLFVTNGDDGVVAIDANGTYINTFKDENLAGAFGVCADNCGNIFVTGYNSHNVVQMSQDGKERFGEVVKKTDRISLAYSITVNTGDGTLIITQQDNDKIKVFDIQ